MLFLLSLVLLLISTSPLRVARDFAGMEERRKQAARLFARGRTQAEVAAELSVSRQSVSRWHADWRAGGVAALKAAGRAGRLPRLGAAELKAVERALTRGPLAHGYPTDMWTLSRVGEVIAATTGVSYHPGHVWRILRQLGWSRQRPARRATERDEAAIARWRREAWPRVKKTPGAARPGSASKTSPGSASSPP